MGNGWVGPYKPMCRWVGTILMSRYPGTLCFTLWSTIIFRNLRLQAFLWIRRLFRGRKIRVANLWLNIRLPWFLMVERINKLNVSKTNRGMLWMTHWIAKRLGVKHGITREFEVYYNHRIDPWNKPQKIHKFEPPRQTLERRSLPVYEATLGMGLWRWSQWHSNVVRGWWGAPA